MTIADEMNTDFLGLTRLLALVNVAMADAGIAIWESKFFYQVWRPITGFREADEDDIAFTFTSDEFNGVTRGRDGQVRREQSRQFTR